MSQKQWTRNIPELRDLTLRVVSGECNTVNVSSLMNHVQRLYNDDVISPPDYLWIIDQLNSFIGK